ncbi:2OG-Fe(II) oxygenase [Hyphomicrobiales bacterium]|jgi:hypothetical protein|nr:2OG-Fe(II) oxygenase [Hyphomicrobiales bacterium]|tara:strand:- start:139 stop:765 length:627 start_codon:yes stop_codon:yes gene_type:complete
MEKIEIKKNQTKSFIGSWSINNDSLAEDIINFFDKNHERHKLSTSLIGKIDKKQKNFIEFKITAKEINDKKIVIFSKFVEILVSCFKDYKKNWDFLNKWEKLYLGEIILEKHLTSGHHLAFHCDKMNINSSHKVFSWIYYLSDIDNNEGSIDFKYLDLSFVPKKGTLLIFPSDWTHIHRENIMKKNEKYLLRGSFHFPDTFHEIDEIT